MSKIPKLGHTLDRFMQGCSFFRRAIEAWREGNLLEYETALRKAATEAVGSLEWTLKVYLMHFCIGRMTAEDKLKLDRPNFNDLMALMQKYAYPPLEKQTVGLCYAYRDLFRNPGEHDASVPLAQELHNGIQKIGQLILTYLSLEEEQVASVRAALARLSSFSVERGLRFPPDLIQKHRESLALTARYARWADKSSNESYISTTGFHLPLFVSPYEDIGGSTERLLECVQSYQRLLVLGEPGMGKTVALERAMWEFSTSPSVVVPVFVPLIQYDGNLASTIMIALNETGVLNIAEETEVEHIIRNYKCVFLFDGLNEVAGSQRDRLYAELASFLRSHPSNPCVITSRSQDDLWRRFHSREMIEDAVVVRRISDDQIIEYLISHLGERKGQELYDRLNQALRGLARIPLLLWLIMEAGFAGKELPGNRGELFDRFVRQLLKREQKQPHLAAIPVHQKIQALGHLAFHLQQEHRLVCSYEEAVRVIQQAQGDNDGNSVIKESLRNGLLMGETKLHFMHQAVQEYFVAFRLTALVRSLEDAEEQVISSFKEYLPSAGLRRLFGKWAKDAWWSEAIVQLAGLTDQPTLIAKRLLHSNPWLAYWCSIEGRPLGEQMQVQIERQTVARLSSPKVEDRLRVVKELARMENPRTIDHLIVALGDPVNPVQELASQTLIRLGEPSVDPLLDSLTHSLERRRWTATRTLGTIWRFPEVTRLGAEQSETRRMAAEVLGNLGDNRVVPVLIAALRDSDGGVRRSAAQSLGKLGDARAVEPLVKALELSYAQARYDELECSSIAHALEALGKPTEEPILVALEDPDYTVRQRALTALAQTWRLPEIADLVDNSPNVRRGAIRKLAEIPDERLAEPISAILIDQEQSVRWEAIRALGRLWNFPTLVDLGDAIEVTRRNAARILAKSPDVRAVEPLIASLRDRDSKVRGFSANALEALAEVAVAPLTALLHCKDREIRRSVGIALAKIGDDKVVETLALAMRDSRWWVRETAVDSLIRLKDRAVPFLEATLKSDDPDISQLARVALRRIGTLRAQRALYLWRHKGK